MPDLVVVGAGNAGLCVAFEAARGGLHVTVIETSDVLGGTLAVSAGHMSAAGTRLQSRHGIDDHPDLHYADIMEFGGGYADPRLVRLAVDEAPGVIDWLEEQGFPFADEVPAIYRGHRPYSRPRTYWGREYGRSILAVLEREIGEQVEAGRVDLRLAMRMTELVTEGGRVAGIAVRSRNGATSEIRGGVTVLACGGYGSNAQLFAALTPGSPRLVTNAMPDSQGDGLIAARAVAVALRGAELHTPRLGLLESTPGSGRVDFWTAMLDLTPGLREVCEIWVNAAGERFAPEDCVDVTRLEHAVLRQPGAEFWVILDSAALARTGSLVRQWDEDRFVAEAHANRGIVTFADDVATLAERAGVDPSGLTETVRAYNAATAAGSDEFGRTLFGDALGRPPFFAVRTPAALLCSFGGLAVDSQFRALRADGSVIDSLHAVGEVIGMGATSGAAFCGGMSVTPALSFGRLLGRRLAGARSDPTTGA